MTWWRTPPSALTWLLLLAWSVPVISQPAPQTPQQEPPASVPPTARILESGGLPAEAAGLLVSEQQGGPVLVAALALPSPTQPKPGIDTWLEIDARTLLAGSVPDDDGKLPIEIYIYALAPSGAIAGNVTKVIELTFPGERVDLGAPGLRLHSWMEVDTGHYQLRALVRNRQTGAFGLRALPIVVPAANETLLAPPLIASAGRWLQLAVDSDHQRRAEERLRIAPAALGLVLSDETLTVHVQRSDTGSQQRLDIRDSEQQVVDFLPRASVPETSWQAALDSGQYTLSLRVERGNEVLTSMAVTVAVIEPLGEPVANWAEGLAAVHGNDAPPPPRVDPEEEKRRASSRIKISTRRLNDGYLEVLQRIASGDTRRARQQLAELEDKALAGSGAAIAALIEAESATWRALAGIDRQALVPLLDFYLERYRRMRQQRLTMSSTVSREAAGAIVALLEQKQASDEQRQLLADYLALLAAERSINLTPASRETLERALELDPGNTAVLLYMGAGLERSGKTRDAIKTLRALVDLDPTHDEARLRLAINLHRDGRSSDAERLLEKLRNKSTPLWIASLVYQELARWRLEADDLEGAASIVEQGLERLPGDEKLLLLDALLLDLRFQSRGARAVLSNLREGTKSGGESPRGRYSRSQRQILEDVSRRWQQAVAVRQPALAAAVARLSNGDTP